MLRELVPQSRTLGVLLNPNNPPAERQLSDLEVAARAIGFEPQVWRASTDGEIETSFDEASDSGPSAYGYTSTEINYFLHEFDRLWVKTGELISDIAKNQRASP